MLLIFKLHKGNTKKYFFLPHILFCITSFKTREHPITKKLKKLSITILQNRWLKVFSYISKALFQDNIWVVKEKKRTSIILKSNFCFSNKKLLFLIVIFVYSVISQRKQLSKLHLICRRYVYLYVNNKRSLTRDKSFKSGILNATDFERVTFSHF